MGPFQQFRFWARRAPGRERAAAGAASLVALALVAWLLVPDGDESPTEQLFASDGGVAEGGAADASGLAPGAVDGGAGAAGGAATGAGGGGAGGAGAAGGAGRPGAAGAVGAAAGRGGCVSPPGSTKGITDREVRVAVVLTEIFGAAANELFDVPTPAEAKADFDAAIAGINKEGGVACRKLVARYYNVNPTSEPGMMQLCRDIGDAGLFAVVDTGSLATRPAVLDCFGQLKIPYFCAYYITETAQQQSYPYLYSFYYKEQLYKNTAFGLRDHGFFDPAKGFKKLGFIYRTCEKEAIDAFRGWLRQAGGTDDKRVDYSVGCPDVFATESDLAQAVLTFQREGVTHVTTGNLTGDIARFTAHAEQQGYRPKYGFPDEALLSVASGARAPNFDNIANALAITLSRDGEHQTPGMTPTPGTQRCNAYRQAAGLPPVYDVPANAGHACDQLWMLQGALGRAPELHPLALTVGLQRTRSIDFSFPQGPNDFTGNKVTTGGQFWRAAQFMPSCDCWQVIQRDFRRGF